MEYDPHIVREDPCRKITSLWSCSFIPLRGSSCALEPSMKATKICTRCKQEKTRSEFGRHKARKDGLRGWCRECCRQYKRTRYPSIRAKERLLRREYYCRTRDRHIAYCRRYRSDNREANRARSLFRHHIAAGKIVRESCEVCGEPNAEGHHDDYSQPLNVRWLCRLHHSRFHADQKV